MSCLPENVNCVLIIKEGFKLDVVTIPGTQAATTFESAINSFTKTYNTYIASGYSEADALAAVNTSLSQKASVSLLSGKSVTSHSGIFYCFSYLGWVLLVMMIAGIAPVLQVFSKKEIKERISCSSYKFANYNRELLLGVILTGLVVCAVNFLSQLQSCLKAAHSRFQVSCSHSTCSATCLFHWHLPF